MILILDAQLSSVTAMLTTFAAAGHLNYAKGARLYLELMERYEVDHAKVVTTFAKKGYSICYDLQNFVIYFFI